MKLLLSFLIFFSSVVHAQDVFEKFEQYEKKDEYFEAGKEYYKKRIYALAYENFQKAAQFGNDKALYNLGILYSNKNFHRQDPKKAYAIFDSLAKKNHAPSQNRMGMYYSLGVVVDKDYKLAVEYFEKSSKQGYITAQCNLAMMYASGKGVFPNFGRAHVFAKTGVEQGNPICKKVWEDYNLSKYPEDKSFKLNFYTKP
jgi:TPR repeat protein